MGSRACVKVDLQKAFDNVNREFVYFMMHCLGFKHKWIHWIKECLSTPTFSILVNGSPSGFIHSSKGIRQGDPISPYIFVMLMEFWTIRMELAMAAKEIDPLKRGLDPLFSHLLFADDLLLFCRANKKSMAGIKKLLSALQQNTGLDINIGKSRVFYSRGVRQRAQLSSILGIQEGALPVRYMGLPLSIQYLKAQHYSTLIDKCKGRTEGWMAHNLSLGGRLELIKTVIYGMISYWSLSFNTPASVIQALNKLCTKFLWRGKSHMWSWYDVCKPKQEGGLGIRRLEDLNKATALKLFWKCSHSPCPWATWMRHRYGPDVASGIANPMDSGTWKFICSVQHWAQQLNLNTYSGTLSYSAAWNHVRVQNNTLPQHNTLWFSLACPKFSICTLRALLDKLPTRDRLRAINIDTNPLCVLCNAHAETSQHLFFSCSFSLQVWEVCCLKLGLTLLPQGLENALNTIQRSFKGRTKQAVLARLVTTAAVWNIWRERNARIFEGTALSVEGVLKNIKDSCRCLLSHCHWKHDPGLEGRRILDMWDIY